MKWLLIWWVGSMSVDVPVDANIAAVMTQSECEKVADAVQEQLPLSVQLDFNYRCEPID